MNSGLSPIQNEFEGQTPKSNDRNPSVYISFFRSLGINRLRGIGWESGRCLVVHGFEYSFPALQPVSVSHLIFSREKPSFRSKAILQSMFYNFLFPNFLGCLLFQRSSRAHEKGYVRPLTRMRCEFASLDRILTITWHLETNVAVHVKHPSLLKPVR